MMPRGNGAGAEVKNVGARTSLGDISLMSLRPGARTSPRFCPKNWIIGINTR